jgi:hypothetical protein
MSRKVRYWTVVSALVWVPVTTAAPAPKPSPELNQLWSDLASADELTATRAVLKLAAHKDAVEYLKGKLRPLKLSRKRATDLITDLGGDNEKVARAAFEELLYLDPRLALEDKELRQAMLDTSSANRRLAAVLCDLPFDSFTGKWHWHTPDNEVYRFTDYESNWELLVSIEVKGIGTKGRKATWTRALRAIAILEQIGTPKAAAILEDLATGHPDAAPTKAAKLARERLRKR